MKKVTKLCIKDSLNNYDIAELSNEDGIEKFVLETNDSYEDFYAQFMDVDFYDASSFDFEGDYYKRLDTLPKIANIHCRYFRTEGYNLVELCDDICGDAYTAAYAACDVADQLEELDPESMLYIYDYTVESGYENEKLIHYLFEALPEYLYGTKHIRPDVITMIKDPEGYSKVSFPVGIPDYFKEVKMADGTIVYYCFPEYDGP